MEPTRAMIECAPVAWGPGETAAAIFVYLLGFLLVFVEYRGDPGEIFRRSRWRALLVAGVWPVAIVAGLVWFVALVWRDE